MWEWKRGILIWEATRLRLVSSSMDKFLSTYFLQTSVTIFGIHCYPSSDCRKILSLVFLFQ
jgi:hypothetical protein